MAFQWLNKFQHGLKKAADYAEKTLAAYRLGIKANGSIAGVRVELDDHCCALAKSQIDPTAVYHPDQAPRIPLEGCPNGLNCSCVYRPVMTYELPAEAQTPPTES